MPRHREFDLDAALDTAMEEFWRCGYEATSLSDLLAAIGIHKGSLYQAFGDKHSLYVAALERYLARARAELSDRLEHAETAREGLILWLRSAAERCACTNARMGCFGVNAIVELAPHDETVREIVARHIASIERIVQGAISRGRRSGEIRSNAPSPRLAKVLVSSVFGLYVRAKAAPYKAREVEEIVATVSKVLDG